MGTQAIIAPQWAFVECNGGYFVLDASDRLQCRDAGIPSGSAGAAHSCRSSLVYIRKPWKISRRNQWKSVQGIVESANHSHVRWEYCFLLLYVAFTTFCRREASCPLMSCALRIQWVLDHSPFESARSISELLQVSHFTVPKHLHDNLEFRGFYFRWVPHLSTPELKEHKRWHACKMIPALEAAAKDELYHIVTGNELWFFLSCSPRRMWTLARDEVVTRPMRDTQTAKFMFTVMWNLLGFHGIDKLLTGAKMNNEHFTINILARLAEKISPERRTAHAQRLIVHMDKCSIHTSGAAEDYQKQNNMMRLRRPSYSPDLALSDFTCFRA
jgi:hypothetical protein